MKLLSQLESCPASTLEVLICKNAMFYKTYKMCLLVADQSLEELLEGHTEEFLTAALVFYTPVTSLSSRTKFPFLPAASQCLQSDSSLIYPRCLSLVSSTHRICLLLLRRLPANPDGHRLVSVMPESVGRAPEETSWCLTGGWAFIHYNNIPCVDFREQTSCQWELFVKKKKLRASGTS